MSIALGCAGCAETATAHAYLGTGVLQTSGSAADDLASQSVVFTPCASVRLDGRPLDEADVVRQGLPPAQGEVTPEFPEPVTAPFTILAIGSDCALDGAGMGSSFVADYGELCTLHFAEGTRSLRVTDLTARYGAAGRYVDPTFLEVMVGGEDTQSGLHALYRFSGRIVQGADRPSRCAERRATHERNKRMFDANSAARIAQ